MEKTRTLLILIGNGTGRQKDAIRSLCAEQGYEEISLFGTDACEFPTAVITDKEEFLNDFSNMIDPLRLGNEYYGVKAEDIVRGHSDRKVIAVPAKMTDKLYAFAVANSVAPSVVNFDGDIAPATLSEKWIKDNAMAIDEITVPVALTLFPSDKINAKALNTVATWTTNYMSKKIDFTELRSKTLGNGRAHDLLKTVSDDSERKLKMQKMGALALAAGMSAAGNVEVAAALLGSFYLARNAINDFNEKNSLFKEQGFSLAERLHYFVFGHNDEAIDAPEFTEKEKNALYSLIDKVDKNFGELNGSAQKMDDVKDLYESAKPSYFKNSEKVQEPASPISRVKR